MVYIVTAYIVMAFIVMTYMAMAYTVMADIVMAYTVMTYTALASIVMAYKAMAPIAMASIVMPFIVMAVRITFEMAHSTCPTMRTCDHSVGIHTADSSPQTHLHTTLQRVDEMANQKRVPFSYEQYGYGLHSYGPSRHCLHSYGL